MAGCSDGYAVSQAHVEPDLVEKQILGGGERRRAEVVDRRSVQVEQRSDIVAMRV